MPVPPLRLAWFRNHPFFWIGPLAGALTGLSHGVIGAVIGLLLGHFIQVVAGQFYMDLAVSRYFENPGRSVFPEGEPGLAAYCALGIYIMLRSKYGDDSFFTGRVGANTAGIFPKVREHYLPLVELFCRIAISRRALLNPDLLAESLLARRRSRGDAARLGEELQKLALGKEARQEAALIRQTLDPRYRPAGDTEEVLDPYLLLGLTPAASPAELKSAFRKLAVQYHPDALQSMGEEERKAASLTFIAIREAYREIMRAAGKGPA